MSGPVKLETERLFLRQLSLQDIDAVLAYVCLNRAFHTPFEPTRLAEYYTRDYWFKRVRDDMQGFREAGPLRLYLFAKTRPSDVVGVISFDNFVRGAFQSCSLGYMLAETAQGKGYMSEALVAAIQYMFEGQNFHRIMANYMTDNERSAAVLKRLGFTVEGRAKAYLRIAGQWRDHVLASFVNDAWRP